MISLDWKERLVADSKDFFERKLPEGYYDFDVIYNAYPKRVDNKIPRDIVVFVADTLATKMQKKHTDYLPFLDYIWKNKGENGKIVFSCILSKFIKKDYDLYFNFTRKYLDKIDNVNDVTLLMEKVFYPIYKKNPMDFTESLFNWLKEANDVIGSNLIKMILKLGKTNPEFLKKFTDKLENKWLTATPEFTKISGNFLKSLGKIDPDLYLSFYRNYKTTREPIFVEILTLGLMMYDDFLYETYENWGKSGNARLKKAAITGLKFLKKKKK